MRIVQSIPDRIYTLSWALYLPLFSVSLKYYRLHKYGIVLSVTCRINVPYTEVHVDTRFWSREHGTVHVISFAYVYFHG